MGLSTPIRTAIVGLGWVGTHRHMPAVLRNPAFELVGLIDEREGRARELAARARLRRSSQARGLAGIGWLADTELVVIATEPARHAELVLEALSLGKHVLTEKPFAMSVADGQRMLAAAASARRTLAVVHNFQFSRSVVRLERDIAAGRLGRIRGLWGWQLGNPRRRLPKWYPELPLGLFYDESPHLLYLLRRFAGSELTLAAVDRGPIDATTRTPATLHARFSASSGTESCPAVLDMFFEAPLSEWYFAALGELAVGVVDIFRDIYVRLPNDGRHTAGTILGSSIRATSQHWRGTIASGLRLLTGGLDYGNGALYQRVAAAVRSGNPPADVDAADGLAVLKMQHAILAAAREH